MNCENIKGPTNHLHTSLKADYYTDLNIAFSFGTFP